MNKLAILVVEDEPEVRQSIVRDLAAFGDPIRIDQASDATDAMAALAEAAQEGDRVGLILADHRMPGQTGVDFLVELHSSVEYRAIRKVLITGQADQSDTIRAINSAGLDYYVAKPWDVEQLEAVVRRYLTDYIIQSKLDPLPFVSQLDGPRLIEAFSKRGAVD